ncbi:hypothetical protein SAMD00019534_123130 [Acytostelium subglobosum LB1]|uniref:hypothetical protein n=1 Tax=Acytostelium subglobosum LB1 TaxID=1410327 RepID=UPI000644AF0B|nr:hypothetical protein SAMD00019534_123130 [Acytostelium subglobosum LB1]GAM29137.1 hypothetical protein SAMD00019534_123130 [Acytostelium subglobosum LB1]|eukprot:XP_012747982.1 hypothetical protein SAMD00019534_123130 [Acytostelium subglobosum LB1]
MYWCKGEEYIPMPRITIKDAGSLSFPVTPEQIQRVIERATRAPYGKGTETITDLKVRRVWQIQHQDISITGTHFDTFFAKMVDVIKEIMGLGQETVTAELYKLLVYDKGGFFLPHRDSEKADKMFGTLVVSLPCSHKGGDLVITHADQEAVVSLENDSMSELKWTAFYADCRHEVKPVTDGNRVCLVYNLLRSGGNHINHTIDTKQLVQAIDKVFDRNDLPKAPAVAPAPAKTSAASLLVKRPLSATQTTTSASTSKSGTIPRPKQTARKSAAARIPIKHLTSLKRTKYPVEEGHWVTDGFGKSRYVYNPAYYNGEQETDSDDYDHDIDGNDDDYDLYSARDDQDVSAGIKPTKVVHALEHVYSMANFTLESLKGKDAVMARVLLSIAEKANIMLGLGFIHIDEKGDYGEWDTTFELTHIKDIVDGTSIAEKMDVQENVEIMPQGAFNKIKPYQEEQEEATGNEGGTFERFYRHAVIVIWDVQEAGRFAVVTSMEKALAHLKVELEKIGGINKDPKATRDLLHQVFSSVPNYDDLSSDHFSEVLAHLSSIKNKQYLPELFKEAMEATVNEFLAEVHTEQFKKLLFDTSVKEDLARELIKLVVQRAELYSGSEFLHTLCLLTKPKYIASLIPELGHTLCDRLDSDHQPTVEGNARTYYSRWHGSRERYEYFVQLQRDLDTLFNEYPVFAKDRLQLISKLAVFDQRQYITMMTNNNNITGSSLDSRLAYIESMLKDLETPGTLPSYMSLDFIKAVYLSLISHSDRVITMNDLYEHIPVFERINTAHPEWIAHSQHWHHLLQRMVSGVVGAIHSRNLGSSVKFMVSLWDLVHPHQSKIESYINVLADIEPNMLYELVQQLFKQYGQTSKYYCHLWDKASRKCLEASSLPYPTGNERRCTLRCACEHCKVLAKYLSSQDLTARFKVKEKDRNHILSQIHGYGLSSDIDRKGVPHTLVLTKNASYLAKDVTARDNSENLALDYLTLLPHARVNEPSKALKDYLAFHSTTVLAKR